MPRAKNGARSGFALIMALGLMSLIVLLLLALSAMLSIESAAAREQKYVSLARQNARAGLLSGLGLLQQAAGPDQRVTATADILLNNSSSGNPQWTGVWKSKGVSSTSSSEPVWLVSGHNLDPAQALTTTQSVIMVSTISATDSLTGKQYDAVRVIKEPIVPSNQTTGVNSAAPAGTGNDGYYAFWLSDESVKAKVNLTFDPNDADMTIDSYGANVLPQTYGIGFLDDKISDYNDLDDDLLSKVGRLSELSLLLEEDVGKYQHDLTAHSWGLLTDAYRGGWKLDLTAGFSPTESIFNSFFGEASENYYLLRPFADENSSDSNLATFKNLGPNMDLLRDYARFFENSNWKGSEFEVMPVPASTGKDNDQHVRALFRYPYRATTNVDGMTSAMTGDAVSLKENLLSPIITSYRFGMRLRPNTSKLLASGGGERSKYLHDQYAMVAETQFFVSLYNPYNVTISLPNTTRLVSPLIPYCHFRVFRQLKDGGTESQDYYVDGATHMAFSKTDWIMTGSFSNGIVIPPGQVRVYGGVNTKSRALILDNQFDKDGYQMWPYNSSSDLSKYTLKASTSFNSNSSVSCMVGVATDTANLLDSIQIISAGPMPPRDYFVFDTWKDSDQRRLALATKGFIFYNSVGGFWEPEDSSDYKGIEERSAIFPTMDSDNAIDIGTWGVEMRTTGSDLRMRPVFDVNIRGYFGNTDQDNNVKQDDGTFGDPKRPLPGLYEFSNDEVSGDRNTLWGLVSYLSNSPPNISSANGSRGYWGDGNQDTVVLFDMPRRPVLSVGAFQHANLGLYFNEPSYVAGNSYANRRISNLSDLYYPGGANPLVYDISYMVNESLWDGFFFSGLEENSGSFQGVSWDGWSSDEKIKESFDSPATHPLPNPRLVLARGADSDAPTADSFFNLDEDGYRALASYLRVNGPFNVNSTSVPAWKALLMGMSYAELPVLNVSTGRISLQSIGSGKTAFPRMSFSAGNDSDKNGSTDDFWKGYRVLSEDEAQTLAEKIVDQVRKRGPFRSMADFVNRKLESGDLGESGALQSAIDESGLNTSINSKFSENTGSITSWRNAPNAARTGDGFPGAITQGDILQALAPVLTVRSDTFKIRAYGETLDSNGAVAAKAWCEAVVQRTPQFCDEQNNPTYAGTRTSNGFNSGELKNGAAEFGRQFKIVSFRWINENEL